MVPESPFGLVAELQQRIAIEASAGGYHSLVLLDDGTVRAFGSRQYGQLGYGAAGPLTYELPVAARDAGPVPLGGKAVAVSAGYQHSLVLLEDGTVRAFGAAWSGKLGYGAESTVGGSPDNLPEHAGPVPLGGRALSVSAGDDHSLALLEDRTVRAFGWGLFGQLGYGTKIDIGDTPTTRPVDAGPVPLGGLASSVDAGARHSIVMLEDGTVRAFGIAFDGRLGYGQASDVGDKVTTRPKDMGPVPLGGRAVAASAGGEHSLVLVADGTVRAFGAGNFGQLGYGSTGSVGNTQPTRPDRAGPVPLGGRAVAVSAGGRHSLVMLDDGTVRAFGSVRDGRLGYGMRTDVGSTQATRPADVGPVPLAGRAVAVSAGESHSVVILEDGTVSAFGDGSFGQLGEMDWDGTVAVASASQAPISRLRITSSPCLHSAEPNCWVQRVATPMQQTARLLRGAVGCAAGRSHSLVLLADGTVRAIGSGSSGQLGYGSSNNTGHTPAARAELLEPVPLGGLAVAVSAGYDHSLVLIDDGTVRAFGSGWSGCLGYPSTVQAGDTPATRPEDLGPVPLGGRAVAVSAGGFHSLVLLDDGTVRAFGRGADGQLGYGSASNVGDSETARVDEAGPVPLGGRAVAVDAGRSHSLAVVEDGTVRAFGDGSSGQLGYGSLSNAGDTLATRPVVVGPVPLGGWVVAASAGDSHSLVLLEDGTVRAFGSAWNGQLGYGFRVDWANPFRALPADLGPVPLGGGAVAISAGVSHSLVVLEDGTLRAFGQGSDGQLGYGSTSPVGITQTTRPVDAGPVPLGGRASVVSAGWYHSLVVLEDGTVLAFGEGSDGKLGYGSTEDVGVAPGWMVDTRVAAPPRAVLAQTQGRQACDRPASFPITSMMLAGDSPSLPYPIHSIDARELPDGRAVDGTIASWRVGVDFVPLSEAARAVSCEGLDAPEVWPSPGTVEVVVGGQSTGAVSGVFEGVARPSVQAVSEAVLGPAGLWRAVLHGSALWRSSTAEDVANAARAVSCEGLDAPEVWPSPGTVEVVVGGQSTGAVSGVFEGVARPSVQAVSEAVLGPAGLWRAVLHGSALWRSSTAEDVANVTIGSGFGRLGAVAWHDPGAASGTLPGSYLGFDLPRGAAAGARVHVVSSAGLVSTGSVAVSFARISVESAWPDHLLAGEQNATVVLRGRNLALRDSDIDAIRVGGVRCASWRVTQAARAVSCEGLDAPEVWPSPGTVEVVVGGQSTGAVSGVFEGVARPSVQAILVAASGGAVRGAKVLLHGTGFGKRTSSISNVTFGGWPATSFRLLDHSAGLLEATLPAGVGSVQVRVVSATGLDSGALAAPSLLYAAPSVVRCEPPALLAGPKSQSLTIFGTNLGFKVTDVDSVEVGGIPRVVAQESRGS
ncbi:hypothetical protein FNF31_04087 [Cafeteria roenbergensis]|uniref:RCC1-like domain-containing protein n=1 Tax=Cafeteria roenbergensis TaxID=33653 RepID=A0A5A8D6M6_CAFRO|nr:hypothetical protein FNF31_04087 [Cafeteria roenbergensis]